MRVLTQAYDEHFLEQWNACVESPTLLVKEFLRMTTE